MGWLERLRGMSEGARNQLAFSGAIVFTALVALWWVSSLPQNFQTESAETEAIEKIETKGMLSQFVEGLSLRTNRILAPFASSTEVTEEAAVEVIASSSVPSSPFSKPAPPPAVIMPDLSNINPEPKEKRVLIGTSSASETE